MAKKNILIIGASRGLGNAFATGLSDQADALWMVSRTEPQAQNEKATWIQGDLVQPRAAAQLIANAIKHKPIDLLIYNAGIWETDTFANTSPEDLESIVNVNFTSLIQITHALEGNIKLGKGNVILIGSTCGLENRGTSGIAYAATKFGMRGVAHSLREYLRESQVRVTCLNVGSMATDIPFGECERALQTYQNRRMPVDDIVAVVRCLISLSPSTCVKEMSIPATLDSDV